MLMYQGNDVYSAVNCMSRSVFREKNNEVVDPIFAFEESFICNVGLIKVYSTVELIVTH